MAQATKPEDSAKPSRQQLAPTGTLFRKFTLPSQVHIILFQGMRLTEYNLDTSKGNRLHWSRGETGTVQLDEFSMPISEAAAIFARDGERTCFAKHPAANTEVIVVNWPESTRFPKGRQIYVSSEAVFTVTQQLWATLISGKSESEINLVVEQLTRELQAELPYSNQFATALDVLNTRLDDPFAPQILSEYLGLSESQIRRQFNEFVGVSPSQYHLKSRLNLAKYYIQTSASPLETVALKCGFASYPTFSAQFKRQFGFTPKNARIR
ncbi:MAG: helix-turn-helix transcriptional regulator [Fimbriimonadaceae bacterium]|nr:MAG: helix-turn-helix transcriptional regulator [Fimbriimonadaceae bacterium]